MVWRVVDVSSESPMNSVTVDGVDVLLVRFNEEWHAVEDRCSHAGCAFSTDGEADGTTLICNCHGSEFDLLTGAPLVMPASVPLRIFRVRERADRLEIDL